MKIVFRTLDLTITAQGDAEDCAKLTKLLVPQISRQSLDEFKVGPAKIGRPAKYETDEERRAGRLEYFKDRYKKHPELWAKDTAQILGQDKESIHGLHAEKKENSKPTDGKYVDSISPPKCPVCKTRIRNHLVKDSEGVPHHRDCLRIKKKESEKNRDGVQMDANPHPASSSKIATKTDEILGKCTGCRQPIDAKDYIMDGEGNDWHKDCHRKHVRDETA